MLIYRRHKSTYKFKHDRVSKQCRCKLWCKGQVEGKPYQKSLKTAAWERAEKIVRGIESGVRKEEPKKPDGPTIDAALSRFVGDQCRAAVPGDGEVGSVSGAAAVAKGNWGNPAPLFFLPEFKLMVIPSRSCHHSLSENRSISLRRSVSPVARGLQPARPASLLSSGRSPS